MVKDLSWPQIAVLVARDGAQPRDLRAAVAGRAPGTELPERVRPLDVEQRLDVPRARRAGCGRRALVRDAPELGFPAAGRRRLPSR